MIIQTAPAGTPRLAIMMYEHTALCQQFANVFGNDQFEPLAPLDPMIYVISHHDAGWLEFDRDPAIDDKTGLPYNLVETPIQHISVTSRLSPEFNQRHHPYTGLISSMHSWGLYNGRYRYQKLKMICSTRSRNQDRPMNGETDAQRGGKRQKKRLRLGTHNVPQTSSWLGRRPDFQNYKLLQFIDTLALYFNRVHPSERVEQGFENVPMSAQKDASITIRPGGNNTYAVSPFPFATNESEFAFGGRPVTPGQGNTKGGWPAALKQAPTVWEHFELVAG